jgi:hypothetical protein
MTYLRGRMSHQLISFIKSGIRIVGYVCLIIPGGMAIAALVLIVSEAVGILEEIGEK